MTDQTEKPKKLYLVWNDSDEYQYFEQFDSLEDALSSQGNQKTEVFIASIRRLGEFKREMRCIRVKPRKKAKKK